MRIVDWQEILKEVKPIEGSAIQFEVKHFCSFAAVLRKIPEMLGVLTPPPMFIYNEVYIEPPTGSITSVFFMNKKVQSDIQKEMQEQKYEKAIPLAERFVWKWEEMWNVYLECERPQWDIVSRNQVINFDQNFMKSIQNFYHKVSFALDPIPDAQVSELRMTYGLNKGDNAEDRIEPFLIVKKWPMRKVAPGTVICGSQVGNVISD